LGRVTHLPARRAERDALQRRLAEGLARDPRVAAAWLHGSLGRGESDDLSDLDVHVVIHDEDAERVIQGRREFARQVLGEAILVEEAIGNAPPAGGYLMTGHDAPTGPHLVDWYWQSASAARRPPAAVWLIESTPLPNAEATADPPVGTWEPTPEEEAGNTSALLAAMILIQAKYLARNPSEDGLGFLGFLRDLLHDVERRLRRPLTEIAIPTPCTDGLSKLGTLIEVTNALEGTSLCHPQLVQGIRRFLRTIDQSPLAP